MRSSSISKKRPEFQKYMESRVLVTSNSVNPLSKNITTKLDLIKQQISRQFHQKFLSDKKRTISTNKNNSKSKSKLDQTKPLDNVIKKLNYLHQDRPYAVRSNINITTQNLSDMQNYRQKFYDLQDKFLGERQKMIDNFEKNNMLKQNIIQFLEEPSSKTAEKLQQNFPSQRHQKIIQKFISMNQDIQFAQTTLKQILTIVEVDDIQTLLTQLKNRQLGPKNLGQCSFKILEMQTAYNKLANQSQQKLKQVQDQFTKKQKQLQIQIQNQIKQVQSGVQKGRKQQQTKLKKIINKMLLQMKKPINMKRINDSDMELMSSVNHEQSRTMFITFDKNPLKKQRMASDFVIQPHQIPFYPIEDQAYTVQQLLQIVIDVFKEMEQSLFQIQRQAQQNVQKLNLSKQDFDRMEKMIQSLTQQSNQQKNKLIQHFEQIVHDKQIIFEEQAHRLNKIVQQKQRQYAQIEEELKQIKDKSKQTNFKSEQWRKQKYQINEKLKGKQKIINKMINIVCDATGQDIQLFGIESNQNQNGTNAQSNLGEIVISKIQVVLKKHLLLLKQNLQAAQNLILWHQKQLQIKQGLLKQFDFNLKKLIEESQIGQQKQKKVSFERDQYKYLLGNLRQSVRQMKKQYEQKILKVAKQKDQQYLNSNKDILRDNQRLNNQIQILEKNIEKLNEQVKAQTASHGFYRKKSEQFQASIIELRKKLMNAESEAARYKQCLSDIEISFRQVQNMSQKNSQKMFGLEEEKKIITSQVIDLRSKSQKLIAQIQVKDQNYNKLLFGCEQLKQKFEKLSRIKQDLQLQNSNLRIRNLQIMQQNRAKLEQSKKILYENNTLNKENKKLMEQINRLTNKLINYVGDRQQKSKNKQEIRKDINIQIKEELKKIKRQFMNQKLLIKDYLYQYKTLFEEEAKQIGEQLYNYLKTVPKQKPIKTISFADDIYQKEQQKNKQKILKDSIKDLKESILNIKQYCEYVKCQFKYQIKVVQQMFVEPSTHMRWQQQKLSNQLNNVLKLELLINSLRNQNDQLKDIVQSNNANFQQNLKQYQNKLHIMFNQMNKTETINKQNINYHDFPVQIDADQSFNRYLNQKCKRQELIETRSPTQKNASLQYKSPQFLKLRKDTLSQSQDIADFHQKQNGNSSKQQHILIKRRSIQKEDQKLKFSNRQTENSEAQRVIKILNCLKQTDSEDPKVTYFEQIKNQYRTIKKRLLQKKLHLDMSGVSFRPNTISSPVSVSLSKDFLQERRFNTDPNDQDIFPKQTNRSEHKNDRSLAGARKENSLLNSRLERLQQDIKQYEAKEQQYKIQISQLEKQIVQLQNQSSSKLKQNLFKSFINQIFIQNWQKAKSNCRTILKLFKIQKLQIDEFMDKFQQFLTHQKQKDKQKIKVKQKNRDKPREKNQNYQKQQQIQHKPKFISNKQTQSKNKKEDKLDNQKMGKTQIKTTTNQGFFSTLFQNAKN